MKTIISALLLAGAYDACLADEVGRKYLSVPAFEVERLPFGSGTPAVNATTDTEQAVSVTDGLYHVPNYMPGFPTAATIWPRELPLECQADPGTGEPRCTGYRVLPAVGRGEYIFVRPYAKAAPAPVPEAAAPPPAPAPVPVTRKKPLG